MSVGDGAWEATGKSCERGWVRGGYVRLIPNPAHLCDRWWVCRFFSVQYMSRLGFSLGLLFISAYLCALASMCTG